MMMIDHGWTDACKGRYNDECAKAVWETADGEEYFERLILGSVKQLISFKNQNVGLGW